MTDNNVERWREEFEVYWFNKPGKDTSKLIKGELKYQMSKSSSIYAHDESVYLLARKAAQVEMDELRDRMKMFNDDLYTENESLKKENERLSINLKKCCDDYWLMTLLLEQPGLSKNEAVRDCIEWMKFRKPLFNNLNIPE